MGNDQEIIQTLLADGVISTTMGTLLLETEDQASEISIIAGAAILGTYQASQRAKNAKVPLYEANNGNIYLIDSEGKKTFIRTIEKSSVSLPSTYKLI
jgi:hypothetical protein